MRKTVETVDESYVTSAVTRLKPGVNESSSIQSIVERLP